MLGKQEGMISCKSDLHVIGIWIYTRIYSVSYYFEFKKQLFHIFAKWKLGCALNSRCYFSLFESLENIVFLKEHMA